MHFEVTWVYNTAIAEAANYCEAYIGRGNALRLLNRNQADREAALASCQEAIRLRPDYTSAINLRERLQADGGAMLAQPVAISQNANQSGVSAPIVNTFLNQIHVKQEPMENATHQPVSRPAYEQHSGKKRELHQADEDGKEKRRKQRPKNK